MRILIVSLFVCFHMHAGVVSSITSAVNNYNAWRAYQHEDYNKAQQLYEKMLIDYPHDAQINYNLGTVYHHLGNEQGAYDSFSRAAQSAVGPLQEQTYFNWANSAVALQKLEEAVKHYQKILELNPHNERAQHNLDIVKKMLEEKKKQEEEQNQQNQNNNKNQDKKDNKNNSKNNQNQPDKNSNSNDSNADNKESDSNEKSAQNNKQQQSGDKNQNQKDDKQSDDSQNKDSQQSNKNDQNQSQNQDQNKSDGKQSHDQDEQSSNQQQKQNGQQEKNNGSENSQSDGKDDHNAQSSDPYSAQASDSAKASKDRSKGKQNSGQQPGDTKDDMKEHESGLQQGQLSDTYDKQSGNEKLTKQLQAVLAQAEKNDEEHYKKMIKAHVKREMPAQFGQKNW